jgi:hypothetical protein
MIIVTHEMAISRDVSSQRLYEHGVICERLPSRFSISPQTETRNFYPALCMDDRRKHKEEHGGQSVVLVRARLEYTFSIRGKNKVALKGGNQAHET